MPDDSNHQDGGSDVDMMAVIAQQIKRFRSDPSRGAEPNVSRKGYGSISNVSILTTGEAQGHRMWLDETFADQVATAVAAAQRGVKSRFAHPSLSGDGIGTFLGRVRNARVQDGRVIGDIAFSKSAHNTPDGDLADYVMTLAENDPESFGVSIVFEPDAKAQRDFQKEHLNEDDEFQSPDEDNAQNYPHARLATLAAADVVDEPAANPDGLFHKDTAIVGEFESLLLYAIGEETERPELVQLNADPDRVAGFVRRSLATHHLEIREADDMSLTAEELKQALADQAATFDEKLEARDAKLAEQFATKQPKEPEQTASEPAANVELAAERERCKQLQALAKNAGLSEEHANRWIDTELSVEQAKAAVTTHLLEKNALGADTGEPPNDPDAAARAEYRKNLSTYKSLGVSEAEFLKSEQVNQGRLELLPRQGTIDDAAA